MLPGAKGSPLHAVASSAYSRDQLKASEGSCRAVFLSAETEQQQQQQQQQHQMPKDLSQTVGLSESGP